MLPTAMIEHFMPGRLRVKVPDRRGDVSFFRLAVEKLSANPRIGGLRANPTTGSILIQHETDLSSIREIAARTDLFDLQEPSAPRSVSIAPTLNPAGQVVDRAMAASGGGSGASVGLMSLAFYQAVRGNALGPATENFWNAYGGMRILNNPLLAIVFSALGIVQLTRGRWAGSASSLLFYAFVLRKLSGAPARTLSPPSEMDSRRT